MPGPKVLFYVQHLLGIGHLARASRVASALKADGFEVTIITGGAPVPGFPSAEIDHVLLPSVRSPCESFSGLVDDAGNPIDDAFRARRTDLLLEILTSSRPDIVILEAFPFGRRQMRFELLPLLDAIRALSPRPRLVTSIRDLLQEKVKPGRNEETLALLNEHFDLVMVHGDPSFARLEDTFPLASEIRPRIGYTGLVTGEPPKPAGEVFRVLISAGGGAAGTRLISASVEAAQMLPDNLAWGLITGPNLPQGAFDRASAEAPPHLRVIRFRKDFPNLLAGAELSVSQAGYNTVGDLLGAGCRSLLIPFSAGGETEQTARAERLAQLGLASMIAEDDLTPKRLADGIEHALGQPKPPAARLDLDGARGSARLLRTLL